MQNIKECKITKFNTPRRTLIHFNDISPLVYYHFTFKQNQSTRHRSQKLGTRITCILLVNSTGTHRQGETTWSTAQPVYSITSK